MRRAVLRHLPGLVLLASATASGQARADAAAAVLSADPVPLGSVVELRVSVPAPPGAVVYFPDKLSDGPFFESRGAVDWKVEPAPGGATLKLAYPLLAFGYGRVPSPGFDVLVGPANGAARKGAPLPGGVVIGTWDKAPPAGAKLLARIPPREVRVTSLFELEGVLAGVGPMPATDVMGRSVGTPALALLLPSALILAGLLAKAAHRLLLPRSKTDGDAQAPASRLEAARLAALADLDDLLALGLHAEGRTREFYTRTSGAVRRYVEQFDPSWGPSLTATELMRGLDAQGLDEPAVCLSAEMSGAEAVKFGPAGSEAAAAEAHWRAVRRWVETSGRRDP